MLENFTDEEIADLLDIGYLHHQNGSEIDTEGRENGRGRIVGTLYEFRPALFGEGCRSYHRLSDLLLCEYLSFDDLRREWRYHGVLLDNPVFCEKITHNAPCPCGRCTNQLK